ncbi:hypothetical protein BYT27DRAFT_6956208 [Phlegmacium glaucopus]|nr:hypothetical protein BYT27DRAFT_6956208 [Phlegmacium glaucopus]
MMQCMWILCFSNNSTSRIEELSDDAMHVDYVSAPNNSMPGMQELSDDEMHVDSCSSKGLQLGVQKEDARM